MNKTSIEVYVRLELGEVNSLSKGLQTWKYVKAHVTKAKQLQKDVVML